MIFNPRRSFSTKLSFWTVLMAVPVFFVSVELYFRKSHQMILDKSVERANGVLNTTMHRMRRYLATAETATSVNSWILEKSLNASTSEDFTRRIIFFHPYLDVCAVGIEPGATKESPGSFLSYSIRQGNSITSSTLKDYDCSNLEWYRRPYQSKKAEWVIYSDSAQQLNLHENSMMAYFSKPLYNTDNQTVGVISSGISLKHISRILSEEKPYPNSYFILIDENGRYVGHPDSTLLFSKTIFNMADALNHSDLIALGYEMVNGNKGHMSVVINEEPSLVCFKPVVGTTWSLAIVCSDSDILHDYHRFTYIVVALLIIGLIIIVLYCNKMVSRSFYPLRKLVGETQEITQGNINIVIPRSKRTDYIGTLQNSYVSMLESLRHYRDSVCDASEKAQRYNDELEKATQLVVEADKQKTAFMQNMTHQLRTPLNIIMGYSQILNISSTGQIDIGKISEENLKNITRTMLHNAQQLNRLVLMLFHSSELGRSESEQFTMQDSVLVNQALTDVIGYIKHIEPDINIQFISKVPDDLTILTNKEYLYLCLGELLHNATKYSDRYHIVGRIELTDTTIRYIVEDTGKGIPQEIRDTLFEFFTKRDEYSEGLGLGLPLIKRHAHNLGGSFYLDSEYTKGCRFIFELPITHS